jgi:hypothetical protein
VHLNSLPFCVVETTNDDRELPKYVTDLSILTDTNKQNITDTSKRVWREVVYHWRHNCILGTVGIHAYYRMLACQLNQDRGLRHVWVRGNYSQGFGRIFNKL